MQFSQLLLDNRLSVLWQYFDNLIELDDLDDLFASSYIRGFLEVTAMEFGDEHQTLSSALYQAVDKQLSDAQNELNAQDHQLVVEFWQGLKPAFIRTCDE